MPLLLTYLGTTDYGIWLTISSVFSWASIFDLGIGSGLRNFISSSDFNISVVKDHIASSYLLSLFISFGLIVTYFLIKDYIPFVKILDIEDSEISIYTEVFTIIIILFSIQLILRLIVNIIQGLLHHSISDKIQAVTQALIILFLLSKFNHNGGKMRIFALYTGMIPILTYLALTYYVFFKSSFKIYRPSFRALKNFRNGLSTLRTGLKFFVIQIAAVVLMTTDNLIISMTLGPQEVVPYHAVYKYFALLTTFFTLIVGPVWSSVSRAINDNNIDWVKRLVIRLRRIWLLVPIVAIALVVCSNTVMDLWFHGKIKTGVNLVIMMSLYSIILTYNMIYTQVINGFVKLNIQIALSIFVIVVNIPLSYFLAHFVGLGSSGVILATIICILPASVLFRLQYTYLINQKQHPLFNP